MCGVCFLLLAVLPHCPTGMKDQTVRNDRAAVQACYIALAAVAGSLLRIGMAQVFGEECANPGTIGWLAAAAPLCVTKDGDTVQEGGIIFSDLPANILGSFLMGTLQSAAVLHLAVPMAVAWLGPQHPFQKMGILHKALTTGFCGSLTTFSSWNSEMVVMIFGTANNYQTRIWSAVIGYIIGMETALGSFVCGKSVARQLHRVVNPVLAAERDAARQKSLEGVPVNTELPDFERRFLPNLEMGDSYGMVVPVNDIDSLLRWRTSTESARRVGNPLLPVLTKIETAILAYRQPFMVPEAESVARTEGWDLTALQVWADLRAQDMNYLPSLSSKSSSGSGSGIPEESKWFTLPVAASLVAAVYVVLFVGLCALNTRDAPTITYRTMVYAMMFAPSGALLRWRLSALNGTCGTEGWEWLPLGTLVANVLGSVVSMAAVGGEVHLQDLYEAENFWGVGTIRAVKVGFAGCLTTVSTFAAEVSGFMHGCEKQNGHAYPYILISIGTSCVLACAVYGLIVFFAPGLHSYEEV